MVAQFLHTLGDFFLTEWFWSITWGIWQVPCTFLYMFFATKIFLRTRWLSALLLALLANLFSFALYSLLVVGILIMIIEYQYNPHTTILCCEQYAALSLALIYSTLQTLFFALIRLRFSFSLRKLICISLISNTAAALTIHLFLPLFRF
jgi:hypothetical protein